MMPSLFALYYGVSVWLTQRQCQRAQRRWLDVTPPNTVPYTLTGHAVAGYVLEIRCTKRLYQDVQGRPWRRWMTLYDVGASVTQDAPQRLRDACALRLHLPVLFSWFLSEERRQRLAIDAYLDLLRDALQMEPYEM